MKKQNRESLKRNGSLLSEASGEGLNRWLKFQRGGCKDTARS